VDESRLRAGGRAHAAPPERCSHRFRPESAEYRARAQERV